MIQDPNKEQEEGGRWRRGGELGFSRPSFVPNTQVETKGSNLTCHVSTHHATHHQIVILY